MSSSSHADKTVLVVTAGSSGPGHVGLHVEIKQLEGTLNNATHGTVAIEATLEHGRRQWYKNRKKRTHNNTENSRGGMSFHWRHHNHNHNHTQLLPLRRQAVAPLPLSAVRTTGIQLATIDTDGRSGTHHRRCSRAVSQHVLARGAVLPA